MVIAANLGFPRIGHRRELKKALEQFWLGKASESELLVAGKDLREKHWLLQKEAGIEHIPSNDFSYYDHILDAMLTFGAIPRRYGKHSDAIDFDLYFQMARGQGVPAAANKLAKSNGVAALEMTKWFDTNYHYLVPELEEDQVFHWQSKKILAEFLEAKALGITTRPVLIGPISFLLLSKISGSHRHSLKLLGNLVPIYMEILTALHEAGAEWIQLDEPCLVLDPPADLAQSLKFAYEQLSRTGLKILLATYFGELGENLLPALGLPIQAIHLDFVAAPDQLDFVLEHFPKELMLSAGIINGRNVWVSDLQNSLQKLERIVKVISEDKLMIAPSCSLLHVPIDAEQENKIDPALKQWLAFAKQKLEEVTLLTNAIEQGKEKVKEQLTINTRINAERKTSQRIHNTAVQEKLGKISAEMLRRQTPYAERSVQQRNHLNLPILPTTTIGSFPQTTEVRKLRADHKVKKITASQYEQALKAETAKTIALQEEIGLDVLVHGEFERNDMVEYFAEHLGGYLVSEHGWVQSYGSRYVKPPIIYGDIIRPKAITVEWSTYAQSLTPKPLKGILTGPVTMLQWSFVRDDQSLSETCRQLALVIREEVLDLEKAGIKIIQIDEPAIREGLPLLKRDWAQYLSWAVNCFRLSSSAVQDRTQIHTHMCYSEFNDIIDSVAALDADVVSIEATRSNMELLQAFVRFQYPNEIGPGVFDIHSPRVPSVEEMSALLYKALSVIETNLLWVNPDCGLKTRRWEEVIPALKNMVAVAQKARAKLGEQCEVTVGQAHK